MRENILIVLNNLLSQTWLFILLGLIHIAIAEASIIQRAIKQKNPKLLLPVAQRALYPVLGLFLIFLSFSIVSSTLEIFSSTALPTPDYSKLQPTDLWTTLKYLTQYTALFSVIGLIIAGISLTLSAGGKWLVNFAKLFITLSFLYLFFSVLIGYA